MKFQRAELLEKLEIAKLGIDSREFIPILSHFCFHGKTVTAYNDFISVQVACSSNFRLALQANTLLKLLSSVRADEVDIGFAKNAVFFKAGPARTGVRARLPYMGEEDFLFKWPNLKRLDTHKFSEGAAARFFNGLQLCLSSVGDQMPSQMGVTLNGTATRLCMYSTNNKAISKFSMKHLDVTVNNIILPTMFCQAVLKGVQVYGMDDVTFMAARDFVIIKFGEDCMMYGKLVSNKDPLDFEKVLSEHIAKGYKDKVRKLPKNFVDIFERALLILSAELNKPVHVQLELNTLSAEAKSSLGKVKSSAVFKKNLPAKNFTVDAELVVKAIEQCNSVYFGKRVVVFLKDTYMHLLATTEEE